MKRLLASVRPNITIWKAYVLALVGNWILALWEDAFTDSMFGLAELTVGSLTWVRSTSQLPREI